MSHSSASNCRPPNPSSISVIANLRTIDPDKPLAIERRDVPDKLMKVLALYYKNLTFLQTSSIPKGNHGLFDLPQTSNINKHGDFGSRWSCN